MRHGLARLRVGRFSGPFDRHGRRREFDKFDKTREFTNSAAART
jgi:hypothetical protein